MTRGIENGDLIEGYAKKVEELESERNKLRGEASSDNGIIVLCVLTILGLTVVLFFALSSRNFRQDQETLFYADVDEHALASIGSCVMSTRHEGGTFVNRTVKCFQNFVKARDRQ
jgi:hypothetical protein